MRKLQKQHSQILQFLPVINFMKQDICELVLTKDTPALM